MKTVLHRVPCGKGTVMNSSETTSSHGDDTVKLAGAKLRSAKSKTLNLALLGYIGRCTRCIGNTYSMCSKTEGPEGEHGNKAQKSKHVHRNTVCDTQHEDNRVVEVRIVDAYMV